MKMEVTTYARQQHFQDVTFICLYVIYYVKYLPMYGIVADK